MKVAVIYTMKGCPHCVSLKEELNKQSIPFLDRDINEFEEEYDEFSKATQNDYVPALMLLTLDEEENATNVKLLVPDRDFNDIYEGIGLIKEYLL
jgi:glutaredoxin